MIIPPFHENIFSLIDNYSIYLVCASQLLTNTYTDRAIIAILKYRKYFYEICV